MSARLSDREYYSVLNKPDARRAMELRCEEAGHDFENGLTAAFQFVLVCKWCGERRSAS
jgi:hypothetical protein